MCKELREYCKIHGRQVQLAGLCGVTPQAVQKWLNHQVPAERVLQIVAATKGKVTKAQLRPDIYPPKKRAA